MIILDSHSFYSTLSQCCPLPHLWWTAVPCPCALNIVIDNWTQRHMTCQASDELTWMMVMHPWSTYAHAFVDSNDEGAEVASISIGVGHQGATRFNWWFLLSPFASCMIPLHLPAPGMVDVVTFFSVANQHCQGRDWCWHYINFMCAVDWGGGQDWCLYKFVTLW